MSLKRLPGPTSIDTQVLFLCWPRALSSRRLLLCEKLLGHSLSASPGITSAALDAPGGHMSQGLGNIPVAITQAISVPKLHGRN